MNLKRRKRRRKRWWHISFAPKELVRAAGAIPVGLCGKDQTLIRDAETILPANLCPLIKSSYGYALTDTCPYFSFSDFLVGETTCDGKKMIRFVHMERRFERELESLWKRGGKGATIAQKARKLLAALTRNGPPDLKKVWKLTDWGEHRVDGCIKYDLGDGFRMICFKRRDHFYFSYVGTHDDCHRWLNRNRSRHNRIGKKEAVTTVVEKKKPEKKPFQENQEEEWDYDEELMARVDEKILRKIFGGIWRKRVFNVCKVGGD